jgi:DNA-binding NtrC family response regulator
MSQPIRVLFVEDSLSDAELILRQLTRGGFEVTEHWRVETGEDLLQALHDRPWDLVVCDYQLPRLNAPMALEIFKTAGMDIPFIIVSGTVGEEIAVSMMKSGAHDYLLKYNLARFVPAVQRELREASGRLERERSEAALRESEERYRNQASLLDMAHDAILVRDLEDRIWYWNRGAERLYGWPAAEIGRASCRERVS